MSYELNSKMETISGSLAGPMVMTLRERLQEQKRSVEKRLADVTQALKFLDENPSFETFHNLIGKTGF